MKYLKSYAKLFESQETQISIGEFLDKIGIGKRDDIIEWWNKNRSHIKIYMFPFDTRQPIGGVFIGTDTVYLNEGLPMPMPPHIRLFLALHESRHCDQHKEGRFMQGYYDTVVNGDKESFLNAYRELEMDANDYALGAMRELGYQMMEERMLRSNESAGEMVYNMMLNDIRRFNLGPDSDFFDLLKKQINI